MQGEQSVSTITTTMVIILLVGLALLGGGQADRGHDHSAEGSGLGHPSLGYQHKQGKRSISSNNNNNNNKHALVGGGYKKPG
ncbi:hypothetical protein ElyMa_001066800 [Elysia marginata]|uniref:Uncharacterized protein n=1 Tax=Elysia marginata TaxID=1093978 RepID=A0AAV4HS64_9GAST|nr:hypothetical protein ElyMa_001066800 [Elysia marginata]